MPGIARVTVEDIEVHFEGDHPHTVVMLHGWPDTYRLWDATVEALKDRYCCVRFTLPGFDIQADPRATSLDDMCEWLLTVVDQVSPGLPVTLLLHDWGCIFGYEFAARHPARVARIVAVDIGDHNSGALGRSLTASQRAQVFGYQFWLALAWKLGGSAGNWMTRRMARALGCRTDPATIGWQMNYPYAMRWFGTVGGLSRTAPVRPACPMLYVYGTRKPFMFHSPGWLDWVRAQPGNDVQALPTGHWVMLHKPEAFHRCVAGWLGASDPAR
ncbi:MAG: alpha/beta fold hydrolase [Rhodoferax sp.]|nr:alpha/beta fold hydrolase [Rhodoferax sp.]